MLAALRYHGAMQRFGARILGLGGLALLTAVGTPSSSTPSVQRLQGSVGWRPLVIRAAPPGTLVDARGALLLIANSRNEAPSAAKPCDEGSGTINRYPLRIEDSHGLRLTGGLFRGQVPQAFDWRATYCNSAALSWRGSPGGQVSGVRIDGAWDGIRVSRASAGLHVTGSWFSRIRDDAIENDFLQPVTIEDTLIDGAFQGISLRPAAANQLPATDESTVTLDGVLLRLSAFRYEGEQRFGALAKSDERSPRLRVRHSIIAIEAATTTTFPHSWRLGWSKLVDPADNWLLWLGDGPFPSALPQPPAGFRLLSGEQARLFWAKARQGWIDCHPQLARLPNDPPSHPDRCVRHVSAD
ncbi:hypothetical protein HMF7854_11735 [Sphingomonas ginkgonis]|uniref:Uncharacterized protein n=1 Tax=Sphingomonas ginkgonis TaxID=2315330 RepID=A0A3R9Y6V3_9SPHN|nr:hypothetical protein [Sphingomonas ginkgonis]RST31435.1 hypothetical protein HMF7854_11735 [Sphingomonas ginkgonis]